MGVSTLFSLLTLLCAGAPRQEKHKIDPWEAWNKFGEGTVITFELATESSGNTTKMIMTKTLDKKGDRHHLKTETIMKIGGEESKYPGEEFVEKPKESSSYTPPAGAKVTEGDEEIEIPAGKFKCHFYASEVNQMKSKTWYSNDVPGQFVKMESEGSGFKTSMVLTAVVKK